jgi:hypothetical protein
MFVQHFHRVTEAVAAAGGHAERFTQLVHGADTHIYGLTDFSIRDVVADTNDHFGNYLLAKIAILIMRIIIITVPILPEQDYNASRI